MYYFRSKDVSEQSGLFLLQSDRVSFVKTILKLLDRGQYSKNDQLSETVAAATSILSYVEPSLVLPFLASRFHMALETVSFSCESLCGFLAIILLATFSCNLLYGVTIR